MSLSHPTLVETWTVTKPAVRASGGLVASQHHRASRVGAAVLADGGNAVDAAVATALAIGTVEPWMSGLGGGGHLLFYEAAAERCHAVDFGMRAPGALDPAHYPLEEGVDDDLFGWPAVREQRNVHGPASMAVPGFLAGVATALERFGTRSLAESLRPAIALAAEGLPVDWYATLKIAAAAPQLAHYPESARCYLPGGFVPAGEWGGPMPRITLGRLGATLERVADVGWRDFYRGDIAASLVADAREAGSVIDMQDLARYAPRVLEADVMRYRDASVFTAPGLTAGPTMRDVLATLRTTLVPGAGGPDGAAWLAYANALHDAYERRLATLGDADETRAPSCTTHISVVDAAGNLVALTQTLLSVFGSKLMLPGTGILMNNGIMWFDPRPGRPNSLGPGKRPLSNMCPVVVDRGDGLRFAAGASGGRRILAAVLQLVSFIVDFRMSLDDAVHQPRIDVSGNPWVLAYETLDAEAVSRLAEHHRVIREPNAVYPVLYACPNVVARDAARGESVGGAFIMSPWAEVAAQ